jgi:hypothetical protein
MTTKPSRDTIYVDSEDEITAIIDKLKTSTNKVVALVLPKRTAALNSAVNLKLLKRAASSAKKSPVLITSDKTIMSLAAVTGVHVAKTLQSKPEIPVVLETPEEQIAEVTNDIDTTKTVGELDDSNEDETIELDNEEDTPEVTDKDDDSGILKKSKLKIPNFDRFRKRLIIGAVILLVLIGGWVWATVALPKAEIIVKTNTQELDTELQFTAKTDISEPDLENNILPAYVKQIKKTSSEKVKTTGERDEGTKATGTLTITNCINDQQSHTIPQGTGFSAGGLTFVTDQAITLSAAYYQNGECQTSFGEALGFTKSVGVTAISGGEKYNVDAQSYSPPAAFITPNGSISAQGSKMSGGTTKIVKIVTQGDLDAAKQAVLDKLDPETTQALLDQFKGEQAVALKETFAKSQPVVKSDPAVGEKGAETTVTITVTYKQTGIKKEYLTSLIEKVTKEKIDVTKQLIQNTGLDAANLEITKKSGKELSIKLETVVVAGPQLDAEAIKSEIAGEKKARTREIIESWPGVIEVDVQYSPFWVFVTPDKPNKIFITFLKADGTQ